MSFPPLPPEEPDFSLPGGASVPEPTPPVVPPTVPSVPPVAPPEPPAPPVIPPVPAPGGATPPPPPSLPPTGPPSGSPVYPGGPSDETGTPVPYQSSGINIGVAFSWAMSILQKNLAVLIGLAAIPAVINFLTSTVSRSNNGQNTPGFFSLVLLVALSILSFLATVGLYRAALKRTQGETPRFDMLMSSENLVPYIITSIVMGLCIALGLIAFCIGALIVGTLLIFAPWHSLDTGAGVGEAFSKSYKQVIGNLGGVILLILIALAGAFISICTCGIGTFFVTPFIALMTAHVYRQVNGQAIAPA